MLRFIEHRVEHDELRPGFDDLLDLLGYFGGAAPDRYPRPKIRVFVAARKPLADASFASALVLVDCHIDSLAIRKSRRITLSFAEKLPDLRRLADKGVR